MLTDYFDEIQKFVPEFYSFHQLYTLLDGEKTADKTKLLKVFETALSSLYPYEENTYFTLQKTKSGKSLLYIKKTDIPSFVASYISLLQEAGITKDYLNALLSMPQTLKTNQEIINLTSLLADLKGLPSYTLSTNKKELFTSRLLKNKEETTLIKEPFTFFIQNATNGYNLYLYKTDILDFLFCFKKELSLSDSKLKEIQYIQTLEEPDETCVPVKSVCFMTGTNPSFFVKLYKSLSPDERKALFEFRRLTPVQKTLSVKTTPFINLIKTKKRKLMSYGMPSRILSPLKQVLHQFKRVDPTFQSVSLSQAPASTTNELIPLKTLLNDTRRMSYDVNILKQQTPFLLSGRWFDSTTNTLRPFIHTIKHPTNHHHVVVIPQQNIPFFFEKFGHILQLSDYHINQFKETQNLKELDDSVLKLTTLCVRANIPLNFVFWIESHLNDFFKKDKSIFEYRRSYHMRRYLCIQKKALLPFIRKYKDLLILNGLTNESADKILTDNTLFKKTVVSLKKSPPLGMPSLHLRIDEFVKLLKKTTAFIPKLTDFIVKTALKDTFTLSLNDTTNITHPCFSYGQMFRNNTSLYIHQKAIPSFIQKHFVGLIQIGILPDTLTDILKEHGILTTQKEQFITLDDFCHLILRPKNKNKIEKLILQNKNQLIPTPLGVIPFCIKTPLARTPLFINKSGISSFLISNKTLLKLTDEEIYRARLLLEQDEKETVNLHTFLHLAGVKTALLSRVKKSCFYPYVTTVFPLRENTVTNFDIPLYLYKKDQNGAYLPHIQTDALPFFITRFKETILKYTSDKTMAESLFNQILNAKNKPSLITKKRADLTKIRQEKQQINQ